MRLLPVIFIILGMLFGRIDLQAADNTGNDPVNTKKTRIGLYGIGLDTYWSQFEGLRDRLEGYQQQIAERISKTHNGIELINTGIVDNPVKAREAGALLAEQGVEAVFLYISTYALSSTVLPVV
ncbi:MAG: hypothetical protein E4H13_13590, partial [Calditrichales bacterium]